MTIPKISESLYGEQDNIMHFFPPAPTHIDQVSIAAGTNTVYTIPAGAVYVILSAPAIDYYVRVDAAAVVPAAGITDGTGSLANPSQFNVRGVTSLGFISASEMYVTIAVYA